MRMGNCPRWQLKVTDQIIFPTKNIRTRKQRTDVGKFPFINRTIKSWNQLPASLRVSFPCKLNSFRKRVKNVVTSKGIQVGVESK